MTAKPLLPLFALVFFAGAAPAQPAPKPADNTKLVTAVYDTRALLPRDGKGGAVADFDALTKLILETVSLGEPKAGGTGPQLVERDGGKLEVRATAKVQGEVKDLLDALERLQDVAVDVKATVIELDPATYEKLVAALPKGKTKPPVLFAAGEETEGKDAPAIEKALEAANKLLKTGRVVQTSSDRFVNGADAIVSARKVVVPFKNDPNAINVGAKTANPLFVKEGFALSALSVVSADRRFVRMRLTESSTAIAGVRKRELFELDGKKVFAQSLDTEDLGATGSATIADGGTVIFRLAYAPKDKVWVVVLQPTIFIRAEQDELKKEQKRLEDKVKRVFPVGDLVVPKKP